MPGRRTWIRPPVRRQRPVPSPAAAVATAMPDRRILVVSRDAAAAVGTRTRASPRRAAASTRGMGSVAGGRRTTVGLPSGVGSRAPAIQRASESGTSTGPGGAGRASTTVGGDAVARNPTTGPTQRRAAQRPRSISSGEGPIPLRRANGRRPTPSGGTTWSSTTHPPTRPAAQHHPDPTTHARGVSPRPSLLPRGRDQVVEDAVHGRHVGDDTDDPARGHRSRSRRSAVPPIASRDDREADATEPSPCPVCGGATSSRSRRPWSPAPPVTAGFGSGQAQGGPHVVPPVGCLP